ncbi:hypothetical protein HOLleu_43905 [Holothuria leucospilota]|uniref:Uncharacterized protein n=1 Tax=Holothuria leucospilota TaxID=206669 RepID=A0A9Q0Y978_HOLLE|nr:hypothetical protein HOLleu_43905 [Holothuria leucospilota]
MEDIRFTRIREYFLLGLSNREILLALSEFDSIIISNRHLKRLMNRGGLFRRKNHDNIVDVALFVNNELERPGNLHGYRWFHQKLRNSGFMIDKETVRSLLLVLDPEGVAIRRRRRLMGDDGTMELTLTTFGISIHTINLSHLVFASVGV